MKKLTPWIYSCSHILQPLSCISIW